MTISSGSKSPRPEFTTERLPLAIFLHATERLPFMRCDAADDDLISRFQQDKPDGSPLNPDVLRRDVLYPALDRLRIPRLKGASGFHAFRHTAGSVVEERTGRLKLAQKLLRHSNVSTTADIYTHTSRQSEREAAVALERAYFGDLFPVVPNSETENKKAAIQ